MKLLTHVLTLSVLVQTVRAGLVTQGRPVTTRDDSDTKGFKPNDTCWLQYCNAYNDLKAAFCGGGTCTTPTHVASCKNHWISNGNTEPALRTTNKPPDCALSNQAINDGNFRNYSTLENQPKVSGGVPAGWIRIALASSVRIRLMHIEISGANAQTYTDFATTSCEGTIVIGDDASGPANILSANSGAGSCSNKKVKDSGAYPCNDVGQYIYIMFSPTDNAGCSNIAFSEIQAFDTPNLNGLSITYSETVGLHNSNHSTPSQCAIGSDGSTTCTCEGFAKFGAAGKWLALKAVTSSIPCTNAPFGISYDPLYGVYKFCHCYPKGGGETQAVFEANSRKDAVLGLYPRRIQNWHINGPFAIFTQKAASANKDWIRIDFGKETYITQVLLVAGRHTENDVDHYFDVADLSLQAQPYSNKLTRSLPSVSNSDLYLNTLQYVTLIDVNQWARYYTIVMPVTTSNYIERSGNQGLGSTISCSGSNANEGFTSQADIKDYCDNNNECMGYSYVASNNQWKCTRNARQQGGGTAGGDKWFESTRRLFGVGGIIPMTSCDKIKFPGSPVTKYIGDAASQSAVFGDWKALCGLSIVLSPVYSWFSLVNSKANFAQNAPVGTFNIKYSYTWSTLTTLQKDTYQVIIQPLCVNPTIAMNPTTESVIQNFQIGKSKGADLLTTLPVWTTPGFPRCTVAANHVITIATTCDRGRPANAATVALEGGDPPTRFSFDVSDVSYSGHTFTITVTATIGGSTKTFSVKRKIYTEPPPDYQCSTRKWKKFLTGPLKLDFGKTEDIKIPTTLEDDDKGVSYSNRCPTTCEVKITSEVPESLFKYEDGKLTIGPSDPTFEGTFQFKIERKGGLHKTTTNQFDVTFVPIPGFEGIKVEAPEATSSVKIVMRNKLLVHLATTLTFKYYVGVDDEKSYEYTVSTPNAKSSLSYGTPSMTLDGGPPDPTLLTFDLKSDSLSVKALDPKILGKTLELVLGTKIVESGKQYINVITVKIIFAEEVVEEEEEKKTEKASNSTDNATEEAVEEESEEAAAAALDLAQYAVGVSAMLNDPDLNIDAGYLDRLNAAKDTLPEPINQIKGNTEALASNKYGQLTLGIKKKVRKTDFNKLKDKQISVKKGDFLKMQAQTSKLTGGRKLQAVEARDNGKQKFIESDCDLSGESLMQNCTFDWELVQTDDGESIAMKFNFDNKAQISLGDEPENIILKFWGGPYIMTEDLKPIFKEPFQLKVRIPVQADAGDPGVIATEVAAENIEIGGKAGIWVTFVVRLFLSEAMGPLIDMLGFFQLVVYFPLLDLKFPPVTGILFDSLISLVTFDLLPTDDYYPLMFGGADSKWFELSTKQNEPLNGRFGDFDYGRFFIMNLGSMWLVMTVTLIQFPIYYLARCCNGSRLGKKIQDYYKVSQFWGTPLDFMTSAYIELCMCSLINWSMSAYLTEEGEHNVGLWTNNVYLCASSLLVVVYPFGLFFFLRYFYYNFEDEEFAEKYENAYSGIRLQDRREAIWVPVLYFVRRAALAATCVLLGGSPVFQFMVLFTSQIITVTYLGEVRPFNTRAELRKEFFNEVYLFIMIYHLMLFTSEHTEVAKLRNYGGMSMIIFTIIVVVFNVGTIVIPGIQKAIRVCRKKFRERQAKRLEGKKELEEQVKKDLEKGELTPQAKRLDLQKQVKENSNNNMQLLSPDRRKDKSTDQKAPNPTKLMLLRDRNQSPEWLENLDEVKAIDEVQQSLEDLSELEDAPAPSIKEISIGLNLSLKKK